MSDFYSAIVFLSAFIMIIMVLLVRSNDLVEYSEKQTIYTISVLVIAGAVSEWLAAQREQCERLPLVSAGYACYHPERGSIEDVIARADQMMYHYKRKLKDTVQLAGDASE